jgi:NitT/TauT family transport system ATP-binding protein
MSAIAVEQLSHVYAGAEGGVPALEDITIDVDAGKFVVIVGPSGCGKTSLLMMLAGLRHQTQGTILCAGKPIPEPDPERVGVVFQEASLFPWLTALDNIEFPLALRGTPRDDRRRRAEEMLSLVGLDGFGGRYPHELSGGMKQRVSIARALAVDPEVLLMDEPFAALDAQNRSRMQEEMGRILASADPAARKTMVLVTHSIEEAILLADHIVVLTRRPGRVKEEIQVTLPRPRDEADPAFIALRRRIRDLIHDEFEIEA